MARPLRERYAHMADVAADLKSLEQGNGPVGVRGWLRRIARVSKSHVAVAGVIVLLAIAVGVAWSRAVPAPVVLLTVNDLGKPGPQPSVVQLRFEDRFDGSGLDYHALRLDQFAGQLESG